MKRTILAVKGIVKKLGSSVQSIRRAYTSKMLRFDLERVQRIFLAKGLSTIVRPRGARSAAPAADALSTIAPVR
jgi:hypothetical protein